MSLLLSEPGDLEAAMAAADHAPKKDGTPTLSIEPIEHEGRVYWSDAALETELGRRVLDVTELGIHSAPLGTLRLGGRLSAMRWEGRDLVLAGDVVNPLGRIAGMEPTGTLEIRDRRRKGRAFKVPATVRYEGGRIGWQVSFTPARRIRPIGLVDQTWGLW